MSKTVAHYSPFQAHSGVAYISGHIGNTEAGLVGGGLAAEMAQLFTNLDETMAAAGTDKTQVLKTTVFLASISDYEEMNEIYASYFGDHKPARSAFAIDELPLGARVEIEAIAKQ